MRQFHLDTCPKLPNWECEWVAECNNGCVNLPCTYELAQTLQPHRLQNLLEDNIDRYNRPCGSEAHLVRLNPSDAVGRKEFGVVVGTDLRFHKEHKGRRWSTDLVQMLKNKNDEFGRIVPYEGSNKKPNRKRNLRNSEFNNSDKNPRRVCSTVGGLISKCSKELPVVADNTLADKGTDCHFLINQQHVEHLQQNLTLKHLGKNQRPRDKWCEIDTSCVIEINGKEYVIGGKADIVATLENISEQFLDEYKKNVLDEMGLFGRDLPNWMRVILDIKRSMYGAEETYWLQLAANVCGIDQDFEAAMVGTIKSPFVNSNNARPKSQKYHLNIISRDGPKMESFKKEIVSRYANQARALDDITFYINWVSSCPKKSYCLSKEYCNFFYESVCESKKCLYDIMKSMDVILPDVEMPKQD